MTKLFAYVGEGPDAKTSGRDAQVAEAKDYVNQGGLSRGAIFNAIDGMYPISTCKRQHMQVQAINLMSSIIGETKHALRRPAPDPPFRQEHAH
jgi:hypothetical protein